MGCQFAEWDQEGFLNLIDNESFDPLTMVPLVMVPDPTNKYDKKAIAIYWDAARCGYIPKDLQEEWRDFEALLNAYWSQRKNGEVDWDACEYRLVDRDGIPSVKKEQWGNIMWFTWVCRVEMTATKEFFKEQGI